MLETGVLEAAVWGAGEVGDACSWGIVARGITHCGFVIESLAIISCQDIGHPEREDRKAFPLPEYPINKRPAFEPLFSPKVNVWLIRLGALYKQKASGIPRS